MPPGDSPLTRRDALRGVTLSAVAVGALGACASEEVAAPTQTAVPLTPDGTVGQAPSPVPATTTGPQPAPSQTVEATPTVAPPAGLLLLAVAEVPVGGARVVEVGGRSVVVAQPSAGTVVGFDAACTHEGCPVAVRRDVLRCPCHGSEFDLLTGERLAGVARRPLGVVPVVLADGNVYAPDLA